MFYNTNQFTDQMNKISQISKSQTEARHLFCDPVSRLRFASIIYLLSPVSVSVQFAGFQKRERAWLSHITSQHNENSWQLAGWDQLTRRGMRRDRDKDGVLPSVAYSVV